MLQNCRGNASYSTFALATSITVGFLMLGITQKLISIESVVSSQLLQEKTLKWLPIVADTLIGMACLAIAIALLHLMGQAQHFVNSSSRFFTLTLLIIACGVSHIIEAWTLWHPVYWWAGPIKLLTALASMAVVLVLPLVIPKLYALLQAEVVSEEFRHKLAIAQQELASLQQQLQEVESHNREQLATLAQRQVAELQQTDQMKDEFLAVLSHELRTPLTSILGWAKLLRSRQFDPMTTARALETIERNANLQVQHVEDLLELSRIIQGKLSLKTRSIDLMPLIQSSLAMIAPAAAHKAIQISLTLEPLFGCEALVAGPDLVSQNWIRPAATLKLPVFGDPERLQQVIWKLLHNAVKFTPEYGTVTVQLMRTPTAVEIRIIDSGVGIAAEFLPYVFDHFRQANSALNRSFEGLGLGLAIVRYLVDLHGGSIQAQSAGVGLGSTFVVTLPLVGE